jgi:biopolymer transport protein ExbD
MPLTKARLRISDYNIKRKSGIAGKEHKMKMVSLSLTSMVDMFAILVIFLLTNSGAVQQWIEIEHGIDLPKAKSSDPPPKGPTIQISREDVFADKKMLTKVKNISTGPLTIEVLKNWLHVQTKEAKKDGYVNIVGDEKIPYGAIRRVISTCQDAGFKNVNLAIQPMAAKLPPKS